MHHDDILQSNELNNISPNRERVDINVDADAGADDLLLNALAEQITGEAEDIPAMAQIVPNKLNVASGADADPRNFMPCDPPNRLRATAAAVVKFTAMLAPRDESQGVKYSTTAPSFPLPSNVINQYREADVEKMSTTKEHDSIHLNRNCSANGTPSKSNPPFDNVSFSPFMNFTPESGNKTVEHAGSSLGFEISSGMLPYNILSVGPYNGERGRGNKDQNDIVEAPAPAVALLGPSTGAGPESALGWLDYPYDFTAE